MSTQGDVTVGIDIGTTSVKAVAVNGEGDVLARARVPHLMLSPVAGAFEHQIETAWQANVHEALSQVATGLDIAAVNVSAMVPSLGALTSGPPKRLLTMHYVARERLNQSQPCRHFLYTTAEIGMKKS